MAPRSRALWNVQVTDSPSPTSIAEIGDPSLHVAGQVPACGNRFGDVVVPAMLLARIPL